MPPNKSEYSDLTQAVVQTVLGWSTDIRSVAHGLRSDLIRLLPHLLVDLPDREAYLSELRVARRTSGRIIELERVTERSQLPTEEIIQSGVNALSDETLVVLAVEPLWLSSLADLIDELSLIDGLSPVWWEAIARAGEAAYPTLVKKSVVAKSEASGTETEAKVSEPNSTTRKSRRLLNGIPWTISAISVAFAFSVWMWKEPGDTGFEVRTAQADLVKVTPRGADNTLAFELQIKADRNGYATILILQTGEKPKVYPEDWDDPLAVGPTTLKTYGPLISAPNAELLIVVTQTPATETLRRAVEKQTPTTSSQLRKVVDTALRDHGYRWAAISSRSAR